MPIDKHPYPLLSSHFHPQPPFWSALSDVIWIIFSFSSTRCYLISNPSNLLSCSYKFGPEVDLLLPHILVSWRCCNKQLKTHKFFTLVLNVRSLGQMTLDWHQSAGETSFLSRNSTKACPCLFQVLVATHTPWLLDLLPSQSPHWHTEFFLWITVSLPHYLRNLVILLEPLR